MNIVWNDKPLKKAGFHINKGATPHFRNIHIIKINHDVCNESNEEKEFVFIR